MQYSRLLIESLYEQTENWISKTMGSHYYIYAEVKVKDKWYNLNPFARKFDGSFVLHPVYEDTSAFFSVCNDLEEHQISVGIPDDMSPELRSIFHEDLEEECRSWMTDITWKHVYQQTIFCVRYGDAIAPRVIKDRPHRYEGYVTKRIIAAFEVNEINTIYNWLTNEEYRALPDNKKHEYSYYQWDDEFDEYLFYRTIYERLRALLDWFSYADVFSDSWIFYQESVSINDVRLFVERD